MLKTLFFLIKAGLIVAVAVYLVEQQGTVEVIWGGYIIETSTGFLAALFLLFLFLYTVAYRLWRAFVAVPSVYRRYQYAKSREQGYHDVTSGLVAVAAGDPYAAEKFSARAEKYIPDAPLTRLLTAQTALLNGKENEAHKVFLELMEGKETAFFGLRGLLQKALKQKDYVAALPFIRRAYDMQPKRDWVIRTLFDVETRNRHWKQAEKILKKAEKQGVFSAEKSRSHRQALALAKADEAFQAGDVVRAHKQASRAFAMDMSFAPAAIRLVRFYGHAGKRYGAFKVFKKAWTAAPHADLAMLWMKEKPEAKKPQSVYDEGKDTYQWAKRLYILNPDHIESQRLLGAAALEARRFREARDIFEKIEDYRLLARLERLETGNESKVREWLEAAAETPEESKWICQSCGYTSLDWSPLCHGCGVFNGAIQGQKEPGYHDNRVSTALPEDGADILTLPA